MRLCKIWYKLFVNFAATNVKYVHCNCYFVVAQRVVFVVTCDFIWVILLQMMAAIHPLLTLPLHHLSRCAMSVESSASSLFGMHHQCVAPLAANSSHSGLSRAISIASS